MKKYRNDIIAIAKKYRRSAIPFCKHFGECGGCLFQDISYENQLSVKLEYLNHLFRGFAKIEKIVPSQPYAYRNRMDFVTAFGKIGLRKALQYKHVVDITSCSLLQEKSALLFGKIRSALSQIEDYDYLHHKGYLRYVVIRQAFFTGNLMVNFVIAQPNDLIVHRIAPLLGEVDSASLIFNDSLADTSFGKEYAILKRGWIVECLDDIQYLITPNSFFQANSPIARELYHHVKEQICDDTVLDLYCGTGTISLYIANRAARVTGVEISQEAVDSAEKNKSLNFISNVDFVCADARYFFENYGKKYSTLILDPPRGGIHPTLLRSIVAHSPNKIIYISCNPPLLRKDLEIFDNYSLESLIAFDMFPQTPHIEVLAILCRK
ncbi:MAG: 23S rRNA (uracil(1939)-C(5))-methyltransferase RlmD [Spirochaetes bacterium]|nr:23S rRNA (uracil(1939)-C(5))-methyltransferase RlmD [Spirochaetota bacterium]